MKADVEKDKSKESLVSLPTSTIPPPLEAIREETTNEGRVSIKFSEDLIVPPFLKDLINNQEQKRRMLKKNSDGSYDSLDAALEAYDKKIEAKKNE